MRIRINLLQMGLLLALASTALASTTWYANGMSGSDSNDCKSAATACKTVGHAISLAASGDSVMVAPADYFEDLTINFNLKVIGTTRPGITRIIGCAAGSVCGTTVTISNANAQVTISKVWLYGGGPNIVNSGKLSLWRSFVSHGVAPSGGGINNQGSLTINTSLIVGNTATGRNLVSATGGGIANYGSLTIRNSTITANIVQCELPCVGDSLGGGIYNAGRLTISNGTLDSNGTGGVQNNFGGGIYNLSTLNINNSTVTNNNAGTSGSGIYNATGNTIIQNSIVANSLSGGNCVGTLTSNGYNLSSDNTCNFGSAGDLNNTNPMIGFLQNNGGPTTTVALLPGSPAIDAGNPGGCTDEQGHLLTTDQRGRPRPDKEDLGGCDMGAYERQTD